MKRKDVISSVREAYLLGRIERMREALELMLSDYRSEGCIDPNCKVCARSNEAEQKAKDVLEELK